MISYSNQPSLPPHTPNSPRRSDALWILRGFVDPHAHCLSLSFSPTSKPVNHSRHVHHASYKYDNELHPLPHVHMPWLKRQIADLISQVVSKKNVLELVTHAQRCSNMVQFYENGVDRFQMKEGMQHTCEHPSK